MVHDNDNMPSSSDEDSLKTDYNTVVHDLDNVSVEDDNSFQQQQGLEQVGTEAEAGAGKDTDRAWHEPLTTANLYPCAESNNKNCWSMPDADSFKVRGKNYKKDSMKVVSGESLFKLRGVDLHLTEEFGHSNIGRHPGILGGHLREKPTFLINFRFPWGVLILYYEIPSKLLPLLRQKYTPSLSKDAFISIDDFLEQNGGSTPHDRALYHFIMGDDKFKNSKLKLIPKVVEGNVLVRKLVKGKPVIIGKKLPISYMYEPADADNGKAEYLEVDLDVGSSSAAAKKIVSVCRKYMSSLTVELAFVVEGNDEEELPERILASARIHHFNPKKFDTLRWS